MSEDARPGPETIDLKYTVLHGAERIEKLVLKRPKGKHMRRFGTNMNTGDLLELAGELSGWPPSVVNELDCDDVARVLEVVGRFFGVGPATGPTTPDSSPSASTGARET